MAGGADDIPDQHTDTPEDKQEGKEKIPEWDIQIEYIPKE
jgi:hypothetical protein